MEYIAEREVEQIINYEFKNKAILQRALTHNGYTSVEQENTIEGNYQRLEFLGDALLDFIVAEELFKKYPNYDEGMLTKLRANIVSKTPLAKVVEESGLDKFIYRDKGNAVVSEKLKSDVFESIVASIYLDSGDIDIAREFIKKFLKEKFKSKLIEMDYKSMLYEYASTEKHFIKFELQDVSGPPHDQTFYFSLFVDGKHISEGNGSSKRIAQQVCSKIACEILGIIN